MNFEYDEEMYIMQSLKRLSKPSELSQQCLKSVCHRWELKLGGKRVLSMHKALGMISSTPEQKTNKSTKMSIRRMKADLRTLTLDAPHSSPLVSLKTILSPFSVHPFYKEEFAHREMQWFLIGFVRFASNMLVICLKGFLWICHILYLLHRCRLFACDVLDILGTVCVLTSLGGGERRNRCPSFHLRL